MTINDLKVNTKCMILSTKKDKAFESDTVIRMIDGGYIYVDPTIKNGKIVNLNGVSNHLIIETGPKPPQIFQYIYPEIYRHNGKTYYRIKLRNKNSVKYNRRHNQRITVNKTVSVRIDGGAEIYTCILKDISAVGFALEFTNRDLPPDHKNIKSFRCVYSDLNKVHNIKITVELRGTVRRIVDTADNKTLYGCQMPYSYNVDRYVTDKENARQQK